MSWRSLLVAACCFLSTSAQERNLTETLARTGLFPAGTEEIVAEFLLSAANITSTGLVDLLAQPGIEELKRTNPEVFYSGQSPAVYPSRTLMSRTIGEGGSIEY